MSSVVCIYNGPGSSDVEDYQKAYANVLSEDYSFQYINSKDIIEGNILNTCALLVMPGGADLPYCEALNGPGNTQIKSYVEQGGRYFGTCAGAYYGSNYVLYDENNQVGQKIEGQRELKFCPGYSRGPLFKSVPHSDLYGKPISTSICLNKGLNEKYVTTNKCTQVYYFGGPFFHEIDYYAEGKLTNILASYHIDPSIEESLFIDPKEAYFFNKNGIKTLPAIVFIQVKKGRVILSGVHLENGMFDVENENSKLTRKALLKIVFKKLGLTLRQDS